MNKPSVVVLISGGGTNLQAIINAVDRGIIDAEIRAVISNVPDAFGLKRASDAGIVVESIDFRDFLDRESFDLQLFHRIQAYSPDLVVLAGFMRILSEQMLKPFAGRMLNVHPSLLPRFKGLHTHRRALEAGLKYHGCSVHFVTQDLDGGPVVIQARVPVLPDDDDHSLAKRVLQKEHIIYPLVIRWFCQHRLKLEAGTVSLDNTALYSPLLLEEISEEEIRHFQTA